MIIGNYFATPIAEFEYPSGIEPAMHLFEKHKDKFKDVDGKFKTTLKRYNAFWANESTIDLTQDTDCFALIEFILFCSNNFLTSLGYDTSSVNLSVENIWMNKMSRDSANLKHSHGGYILSGCYYVNVPKDSSPILFYDPKEHVRRSKLPIKSANWVNSDNIFMHPKQGDLLLWESHLFHSVDAHNSDEERRVIAFDIKATWKE